MNDNGNNPFNNGNSSNDDERRHADWVPSDAIASLAAERQVHPEETEEDTARRLLKENVDRAVLGIVHISQHGSNEKMRFDASKYIVERVLGKAGEEATTEQNPIEEFLNKIEAAANSGSSSSSSPKGD